ncbi:MAG: signal peptide peptidase SppA [Dysgonomonas sp.]
MKSFFKYVCATIVGILAVGLVIFLVLFAVMAASVSSSSYSVKDNTVLLLNMQGVLKDRTQSNPLNELLGLGGVNELSLVDIKSAIKKAKENDKIKGIYIRSGVLSASNASLIEIRNDLEDFKKSGKFIVAYGDIYTQGMYYLSSVSDKVILNPKGNLDLHGIVSSRTFYKGTLDKLGIEMQVFKVGTYKSAVEPFMQEKMSDANREQVNSYAQDIWGTMLEGISASRNISVDVLNSVADTLPMLRKAEYSVQVNLADTLMYETDVKQYLMSLMQLKEESDLRTADISDMKTVPFKDKNKNSNKIAVLYAEGDILSGDGSSDIQDRYFIKQLKKLKDDKDVKAVVFRVNSGGGSAYASEQIWKAVKDLKAEKPVVVSMGDYAASGGYYISCNATKIFAQPSTLTGSIGIFGMFPNVEGLTKKIGFTYDNVKTNKFSDFGDVTRPMREDEKQILQSYIEDGYDLFITRCAEGRGVSKDSINTIGQGRVWTGNQALKLGLVDAIGGIDDAIAEAAKLAEIDKYAVREYPRQKEFWEEFLSNKKEEIAVSALKEYFGNDYELIKTVKTIKNMKEQDFIQARLPYDFQLR